MNTSLLFGETNPPRPDDRLRSSRAGRAGRWLLAAVALLGGYNAQAQTATFGATIVPVVAPATSTFYKGPIYRSSPGSAFNYSRFAYLYTAAELNAAGIVSGATITGLGWLKSDAATVTGNNSFEVRLGNTALAALADFTTWSTYKTGTTVTYTSATQQVTGAAGTYFAVTNTTSFVYNGGNLLILTDWTKAGIASASVNFVTNDNANLGAGIASSAALTDANTLTTSNSATSYGGRRPTLQLTYTVPPPCTAPPTAGTTVASQTIGCGTVSSTLSLTGSATGTGLSYQWQQSSTGTAGSYANVASGGTGSSYTATGLTSSTYFQAIVTCSGQSATSTPVQVVVNAATPAYATLPIAESFESWVSRCANTEVPGTNWRNTPTTGDNSWRRNNQGSTANWQYLAADATASNPYTSASSQGSFSARFHSYGATSGSVGTLDLFVDLSAAGTKTLTFDYFNKTGTDMLEVQLSSDGGGTFGTNLLTLGISATFGGQSVVISGTSATSVIRFKATSDFGDDDIGFDNLRLNVTPACPGVVFAPTTGITGTTATLNFNGVTTGSTYTITYTPAGGTATTVTPAPTASPVTLTGLQPATLYTVTATGNCAGSTTSPTATTTFTTSTTVDAGVLAVYTLGQLPVPFGTPHAVSAALRNGGTTATALPATLTVTGPSGFSFTDTQTSASVAAGATGTVTFASYSPTVAGTYTVTVTTTLAGDQVASNNSSSLTQTVNTTTIGYSSANAMPVTNGSVGFNTGTGTLVAKFTITASRQVTAVNVNVDASAIGQTIYGVVLSSTGALLSRSANFVPTAAGLATFTLQTPVTVAAGAFFAGLAQTAGATGYFPMSTEAENPTRPGTYFTTALAGGTPTDVATNNLGRFIIEAVTVDLPSCGQVTGLTLTTQTDTSLGIGFTPPAGTTGATYTVTLTPTAGAPVSQTVSAAPATFTGLTPGTSYAVSVVTNCAAGAGNSAPTTATVATLANLIVSTAQTVGGAYYNVTVTSTGSITGLTADLNVSGLMTVQSGGSVRTDAISYYIRGTGRFVLDAGATLIETNAAGITNTGSGGFLLTGTIPVTFSPDANYIFAGTSAQVTGALLPAGARNLTVNNSAGLTLTNNLAVAQVVRLQSGSLRLSGKSLLLPSSAAGTALVDNSGGGTVIGATASMQRAITSGVAGPAYRQLSSPVASIALDSLRTGGFTPLFNAGSGYNTSATPGSATPFPTVFGYDQSRLATATSNFSAFDKGWYAPQDASVLMLPTQGFTVNAPKTGSPIRFTGTLNSGTQNSGTLSRGTDAAAGWQLLGNPYPSPLDWSTVTAAQRVGMDGAMYVFQSTGQYSGTYRAYTNGIGPDSPIIEAGSAYFVRVTTPGSTGAVNLTNTNRVTTFGNPTVFGRTADTRAQLQLQLRGANLTDNLHVYLQNGATAGVDAEFDAVKLLNSTGLNLSSVAGTELLAIDGRSLLTASTIVPLHVGVPAAGTYTLEAASLLNFSNAVYLNDAATGLTIDLRTQPTYTFTTTATTVAGRFSLRMASVLATTPALTAAEVSVYPNPAHDSFTVQVPAVAGAGTVQADLLNTLGQVVRQQSVALPASGARLTVGTTDLATGVYTLRLKAGSSTIAKRVVIQ